MDPKIYNVNLVNTPNSLPIYCLSLSENEYEEFWSRFKHSYVRYYMGFSINEPNKFVMEVVSGDIRNINTLLKDLPETVFNIRKDFFPRKRKFWIWVGIVLENFYIQSKYFNQNFWKEKFVSRLKANKKKDLYKLHKSRSVNEKANGTTLYRVNSVVPKFEGCHDVPLTWLRFDGPNRFDEKDYHNFIENFDAVKLQNKEYAIQYIDELFTFEEVELVKDFVTKYFSLEIKSIEAVKLPINGDLSKYRDLVLKRKTDCVLLRPSCQVDSSLPFEIGGYYILEQDWEKALRNKKSNLSDKEVEKYDSDYLAQDVPF